MRKRIGLMLTLVMAWAGIAQAAVGEVPALELVSGNTNYSDNAFYPAISADGRFVAFSTSARLVPHDGGGTWDVHVRELATGRLERISITDDPDLLPTIFQAPALSADGRFVAFEACAYSRSGGPGLPQNLYLYDRTLGTLETIGVTVDGVPAYYPGSSPALSDDGRYLAFKAGSGIYLRDRQAGDTSRLTSYGSSPVISGNGRFIAYRGWSSIEVWDQQYRHTELLVNSVPGISPPTISRDGRFVVYEGRNWWQNPAISNIFLYDRLARTNRQVASARLVENSSYSAKPQLSADGRFILFQSCGTDLLPGVTGNQLYLYDIAEQTATRLPLDNLWSSFYFPYFAISGDGGEVVFQDVISTHLPDLAKSTNAFGIFALRTGLGAGSSVPPQNGGLTLTAEPSVLSPPNSKFVPVKLSVPAEKTATVEFRIQDEYGVLSQTVPGNNATVQLEAWRNGDDTDGRSYTITAVITAPDGKTQTGETTVTVPHDQR